MSYQIGQRGPEAVFERRLRELRAEGRCASRLFGAEAEISQAVNELFGPGSPEFVRILLGSAFRVRVLPFAPH
jgi:hypothetical protein